MKEYKDFIKNTLIRKAGEYNLDYDRLSIFKRAAKIQQQTQAQSYVGSGSAKDNTGTLTYKSHTRFNK